MIYFKLKRIVDLLLSLIAFMLLLPIFVIIAIAIKIDSPGPIFFMQKRVGIKKSYFNIIKFRTMRVDTPSNMPTHMLKEPEKWITRVGKFLRKTSLDEIPQIINVIKGDMSFVGPRPALWNQYDLINKRDFYGANNVPAGITGWAQINGRDEIDLDLKAKFDGEYVEKFGALMDIKCFVLTIIYVLKKEGVLEGGTNKKNFELPRDLYENNNHSDY